MSSASQRQDILRQQSNNKELWLYVIAAGVAMVGGLALVFLGNANTFILAAAVAAAALILRDYRLGVVLLIVFMPLAESEFFPRQMLGVTGLNPLNMLLMATLASYLLKRVFQRQDYPFIPAKMFWLYLIPIAIGAIHGAMSADQIPSFLYASKMLSFDNVAGYLRDLVIKPLFLVLFALLIGAAVYDSDRPVLFMAPALISVVLISLMALLAVATSGLGLSALAQATSRGVMGKVGMHANELGLLFNIAYALVLFTRANLDSAKTRFLLFVVAAMLGLTILLTFSRGGFLGFAITNLIYMLTRGQGKAVLYLLLAALVVAFLLPHAFIDRAMTGVSDGNVSEISAGRVDTIWMPLLPELFTSPLIGHGISSILWSEPMKTGHMLIVGHTHNAYLGALMDVGIIGFAMIMLFYKYLWDGFRKMRNAEDSKIMRGFFEGGSIAIIVLLIQGITDDKFFPTHPQVFLWMAIGILFGRMAYASRKSKVAESMELKNAEINMRYGREAGALQKA
ncbi:O-antigen ligase family protein [Thermithiobacillus plumbiphilus]|uniref:O-antigen ligase family protein n=1 Tax=Thermithiobacillus plumbiphilus TaxID=1729899 RepID=A0ABU9D7P7_9PROT